MIKKKYWIVGRSKPMELIRAVNQYIAEGYSVAGGMTFAPVGETGEMYYQAMFNPNGENDAGLNIAP